jgi:DNA-binding IclR family transcriptional regulator
LSTTVAPRTITTADLARRLDLREAALEQLLEESEVDGTVIRDRDGWRLSPAAERLFGRALREMGR